MANVRINGKDYTVPEMDFNAVCELEERGINLLNMGEGTPKIATMLRGITAWVMGVDNNTAAKEIQEHIMAGGNIGEILDAINVAMDESGFFNENRDQKSKKVPMDHQRKSTRNTKA